jgi:hypothetical protein
MTGKGKRQRRLAATALAAALSLLAPAPASGTTLARLSLGQLTAASALIVRARCLGATTRWEAGEIWTFTRFRTLESFRGAAPGSFTVRLIGGKVGSIESVVAGVPRFRKGEEAVLFLSRPRNGNYGVIAWVEGTFRVERNAAGRAFLTQESSGQLVYDRARRAFQRQGIRRMPLATFRQTIGRLASQAPAARSPRPPARERP